MVKVLLVAIVVFPDLSRVVTLMRAAAGGKLSGMFQTTSVTDEPTRAISFEKVAPPSVEKATVELLTASLSVAVNWMVIRVPAVIKPPPPGVTTLTLGAIVSMP